MVRRYREVRRNPLLASDAVLALFGITSPTEQQRLGAMFVTDFAWKAIRFFEALSGVTDGQAT